MSNRRRLRPPATITAAARAYQCGHCQSLTGKPRQDPDGVWHLDVRHDNTCPVINGTVSHAPAGRRALAAATASTGQRALYITTGE